MTIYLVVVVQSSTRRGVPVCTWMFAAHAYCMVMPPDIDSSLVHSLHFTYNRCIIHIKIIPHI